MNITLEINDQQGHRVEKATVPIVLGRGPASDVQLSDPCVSRRHCRIECVSQESLALRDLDSKNGTFLDGIRVTEAIVSPSARLTIGGAEITVRHSEGQVVPPVPEPGGRREIGAPNGRTVPPTEAAKTGE